MARFPANGVYLDGAGKIVKGGTVVIYEFLSSDPSNPTVVATFYENQSGGNAVTSLTTDLNGVYLAWLDSIDYDGAQIFTLITSKSTHTDVPFHFTLPGLVSVSQNVTAALDNLVAVAINTSLTSDTDVTDDLGTGDIRWNNGYIANLRSGLTANDTLILQGRDVNGASWQDVFTITSADTVLADLWAAVTIGGNAILNAGTDVTVPQGGSGRGTATAFAVICGGTTSTAAHQSLAAVGTSGQILTSNGAGALPTFQAAAGGGLVDIVDDVTPQLGGDLDINGFTINSVPINYRQGLNCKQASTVTITIEAGVIDVDGTRIEKTSDTTLTITTANNWIGGSSLQATGTYGYVYIDASGNILMHTTAPNEADTSSNTSGILRYNDHGGATDYRMLGWFYMNATGSGELSTYEVGNLKDGDVHNTVVRTATDADSITDTSYGTQLENTTIHFYSSGRGVVNIAGLVNGTTSGGFDYATIISDGSDVNASQFSARVDSGTIFCANAPQHAEAYPQGGITFLMRSKVTSGTWTIADKTITISEE